MKQEKKNMKHWLYEWKIFNTISLTVSENYFYLQSYLYTYIRLKYFEFESEAQRFIGNNWKFQKNWIYSFNHNLSQYKIFLKYIYKFSIS